MSVPAERPAVLFVCGHSELAKAYDRYQQVCIDLVRSGFVVLAMTRVGFWGSFLAWEEARRPVPLPVSTWRTPEPIAVPRPIAIEPEPPLEPAPPAEPAEGLG